MARSSGSEWAGRVNVALALIKRYGCVTEAAAQLVSRYGISKRQAYRYLREAQLIGKEVPIPEKPFLTWER